MTPQCHCQHHDAVFGVPVLSSPPVARKETKPALTLQQRKQELVRNAIWDAATDLFLEKGFDETTVDDIAGRAGVSRRSFFRYYASKSDLIASGLEGYGTFIVNAIEGCPATMPGPEIFRHAVSLVARECTAHPGARKVMQILAKYPAANEAQHSRSAELRSRIEAAFAKRKRNFGSSLDPRILAGLILAVLNVIFQSWFEQENEDIAKTADRVLATLGRIAAD